MKEQESPNADSCAAEGSQAVRDAGPGPRAQYERIDRKQQGSGDDDRDPGPYPHALDYRPWR